MLSINRRSLHPILYCMSHTDEFEGKLSGNLCDCVAYGIPYIAAPIEPLITMQSRYGDIGFLCEFGSSSWATEIIGKINRSNINMMAKNIQVAGADHSFSVIINELDRALQV